MSDVQLENGYARIANEILDKVALLKLSSLEHRILLVVWRYTYGFSRKEHELSISFIQKSTDGDSRGIQRALKNLETNNIIHQRFEGQKRIISFNKNYDQWFKTIGKTTLGNSTVGEITEGEMTIGTLGNSTVGTLGKITYQERNKENIKKSSSIEPAILQIGERPLYIYESVIDLYKHYFVVEPSFTVMNMLNDYIDSDEIKQDAIAWAMRETTESAKDWRYCKGILNRFVTNNVKTAEQAEYKKNEHKSNANPSRRNKSESMDEKAKRLLEKFGGLDE